MYRQPRSVGEQDWPSKQATARQAQLIKKHESLSPQVTHLGT